MSERTKDPKWTGAYAGGNVRQPVSGDCSCGLPAVIRLKGEGPPLCMTCYMRGYARIRGKNWKRASREYAGKLKEGKPCTDCGGTFHIAAMEWDHVPGRGPKLFELGRGDHSLAKVQAEIAKCDLVCANCHRVRTWDRRRVQGVAPAEDWLPVAGGDGDAIAAEVLF